RTGVPADLEVLTLAEAAAYLRVDEKQVRQMVQQGALPGRQIGDDWRFFKAALQAWLSNAAGEKERLMELAGAWKTIPISNRLSARLTSSALASPPRLWNDPPGHRHDVAVRIR